MELDYQRFRDSFSKAGLNLWRLAPLLIGTALLIALITTAISKEAYSTIFTNNLFLDSFIGAFIGSVSVGNPLFSYIIGGEMVDNGIGLIAVTAFIIAWSTVGIIQFPAESMILGKRFALIRNILGFAFAIISAIFIVIIINILGVLV